MYRFLIFSFCFYCSSVLYYFFPSYFRNKKDVGIKPPESEIQTIRVLSPHENCFCGCSGILVGFLFVCFFYLMLFNYWVIETYQLYCIDSPKLENNRKIASSAVFLSHELQLHVWGKQWKGVESSWKPRKDFWIPGSFSSIMKELGGLGKPAPSLWALLSSP